MNGRWVHQPPPHPLLGLMMNSCFGTCFHNSFLENLTVSSCHVVLHLFLLRHPESEVSRHQTDLNLGQIWWLEHFPRVITLVFISPDKVMSCLAHLARGPIVTISFLARLSFLPWGNCKTYSTSGSWWILCVSKVWSSPNNHIKAISMHVCGTPIFMLPGHQRTNNITPGKLSHPSYLTEIQIRLVSGYLNLGYLRRKGAMQIDEMTL